MVIEAAMRGQPARCLYLRMKALEDVEAGFWGQRYPSSTQSWRRNWEHVVPFFVSRKRAPDHPHHG